MGRGGGGGGGGVTWSEKKREGCGAGTTEYARVCMRARWLHSIYVHICVWSRGGGRGGGGRERARKWQGRDKMRKWGMGGGSGWWRGRGENKKWFGDKGDEDFF